MPRTGRAGFIAILLHRCAPNPCLTVSTYGGVYMLWYQDTSPLCLSGHEPVCTGVHPYFWVGSVYFALSVCWPHLKLLLLHGCFYAPMRTARRRNALYWLTFGVSIHS